MPGAVSVDIGGSGRLTMPDNAANSTTADFEIIARVKLDDWDQASAVFFEKDPWPGAGARSFQMSTNSFGMLMLFTWNSGGGEVLYFHGTIPTFAGLTDNTYYWLRITFDANNGAGSSVWTVQYAADQEPIPSSWTTIGSPVGSAVTNIGDGPGSLAIGSINGDSVQANFKYFSFSPTIGGAPTVVFNAAVVPATSPTSPPSTAQTGGTWSLISTATWEVGLGGWGVGHVRVA